MAEVIFTSAICLLGALIRWAALSGRLVLVRYSFLGLVFSNFSSDSFAEAFPGSSSRAR